MGEIRLTAAARIADLCGVDVDELLEMTDAEILAALPEEDDQGIRLAGADEVADLLGVDVDLVADLPSPPFPQPFQMLEQGRVWIRADIEDWPR